MAWVERRRKKWRIRDWVNGEKVTVIKDAGQWKELAEARLTEYRKSKAAGDGAAPMAARSISVEEACDLYFKHHCPSMKQKYIGNVQSRLRTIKQAFHDRQLEDLTKYDVRDFLARWNVNGTILLYLATITTMYHRFKEWNKNPKLLGGYIKLPTENPGPAWRAEMKPHQKKGGVRKRVLTPAEWQRFRTHLMPRTRAICDIALRRFLRLSDIRQLNFLQSARGMIEGVQSKTGQPFQIPVLDGAPRRYNFTAFEYDFKNAQIAAGMFFPKGHPLRFSVRDLRRTGATWAYLKTKDLVGISRMLGHTDTKMTERYLHLNEADLSQIAKAVDDIAIFGGAPVGQDRENAIK